MLQSVELEIRHAEIPSQKVKDALPLTAKHPVGCLAITAHASAAP